MSRKGQPSALRGRGRCLAWLKEHVAHQGEECLIWPFSCNHQGYGSLGYFGKVRKAHHIMCLLAHGERPTDEHHAAHSCGNGHLGCVHPCHLSWKTPLENRLEANAHGTGNAPAPRRLTIEKVEQIRASSKSYTDLAAEYGVGFGTIGKIKRGETWTNPRCKLTVEQIRRIRAWSGPSSRLAAEFGLSVSQIQRIRDGGTHQGVA